MHALHKQASMSAVEFQQWGQRVVYHPAGAAMQASANLHASTMMIAKASDLVRGRTAPEAHPAHVGLAGRTGGERDAIKVTRLILAVQERITAKTHPGHSISHRADQSVRCRRR